jgi:hypothetical protein
MTRKYTLHPYIDKLVHPEIVMLKMHCNGLIELMVINAVFKFGPVELMVGM